MVQTVGSNLRIGLLGGTFDPIHNGHLAIAGHVKQELGLDSIWFIPAALPPHKDRHVDSRDITGFAHRLAMLKLATSGISSYTVTEIEAQRTGPSYSIDTLNVLLPQFAEQEEFYFIIGIDAFLEINTWKKFQELPDLVHFVIVSRPSFSSENAGEVIQNYFDGYEHNPARQTWTSPHNSGIFILQHMEPVPVSSTEIREKIRSGENIKGMVHPSVEHYIKEQGLYK